MRDSRKGLEEKTKRELVELLLAEVTAWAGEEPLAADGQERARELLTHLYRCPVWLAESHWHSLCDLWLTRSARPDPWLRDTWLGTLQHWLRFLAEDGFEADSLPSSRSGSPPLPQFHDITQPAHLPFGFVRLVI